MYEASGYRTRFISYEIVSKICDAPVQPGAIPVPTGRLPAVAAAAAAAAADAVREAAAAAAEGGGGEAAETKTSTGDIQAYGLLAPTVEVSEPGDLSIRLGATLAVITTTMTRTKAR